MWEEYIKLKKKQFKIFIFTFFVLHFTFLFSDTIIDSVYSDPILDGYIYYSQNAQAYQVNNWMYDMGAGDTHGPIPFPDPNSYFRSFFTFYLPDIPEGYHIDSVYVRLYQFMSGGYDSSTGQYTDFPVWNVAGGDTIKCIMSHINYGNELDIGDWEKGDVGNPNIYQNNIGTITESGIDGYRYLDVTASVIQDYELNRDKTQYRIAFQIDTDWDNESDMVAFFTYNGYPPHNELKPILYLTFSDEISSTGNEEIQIEQTLNIEIYPNPFNPTTTISFELTTGHTENTELSIYNIKGQKVKILLNEHLSKGNHSINWDGKDSNNKPVTSGIYFYKLSSGKSSAMKKMLLLK